VEVFYPTSTRDSLWKLKLIYDRQSVGQFVLVLGSHLEPMTGFNVISLTIAGFLMWSTLSDERIDV
jgi:hypothetical protein